MLSQYNSIQSGADLCRYFGFPDELKEYEVEVIVKPKASKAKKNVTFTEFEKSIEKYKFNLPKEYKFDREETIISPF